MPMLVTPMGQGLLPAGQQMIGWWMIRLQCCTRYNARNIQCLRQSARGCCLRAGELTAHDSLCG